MSDHGFILGFYQNLVETKKVVQLLRKAGFTPLAAHQANSGNLNSTFWISSPPFYSFFYCRQAKELINEYKKLLMPGESILVIESKISDSREVLALMRGGKNLVATFILPPVPKEEQDISKNFLPRKPLTPERLTRHAINLAKKLEVECNPKSYFEPLLKRLQSCEKVFKSIYATLQQTVQMELTTSLSSEWFLDNAYVIEGHIEHIRTNLPQWFYRELPEVTKGGLKGLPRAYNLAVELVAMTDGRLEEENIKSFLEAFQSIKPLNIGELWAIPLLIRLRLIECLQHLAVRVIKRQREGQEADLWANRILNSLRKGTKKLYFFLGELAKKHPHPTSSFAGQLIDHVCDEKEALDPLRAWFSYKLGSNVTNLIQKDEQQQTVEQISLSNIITSLLKMSRMDWRDVFESICPVDKILAEEASKNYLKMNFETRDSYRHVIEDLSRNSHRSENEVAKLAVELTTQADDSVKQHVGYYLIDEGRSFLNQKVGYRPTFFQSIENMLSKKVAFFYFFSFAILTLMILRFEASLWFLALLPASEIALQVINYLFTKFCTPKLLPKMSFRKGIPDEYRTLIVVPMLLTSLEKIREEVAHLEIRYLGNIDANLRYALFADFIDANEEETPEDHLFLQTAIDEINALNVKHHSSSFFLFARKRQWSPGENKWIGWERKRGKIEALNRFLLGDSDSSISNLLFVGDPKHLQGISFVITLDADTQLPRNKACSLIEVLAHPLNRPVFHPQKKTIERGYTIIQPRVSTSLLGDKATIFTRIFSDPTGTDPYSWAVSDLYQDVFKEGIYHGKGIYDLKAFYHILNQRLPDNHILSHDLLEGCYGRVGFASDIELYDEFPENYFLYSKRLHRWIRGDWQLLAWLGPTVPKGQNERERNPLSFINRWKIFDNLRRSLVFPSLILFMIVAWFTGSSMGSIFALAVLFVPFILPMIWQDHLKNLQKGIFTSALLPHQAWLSVHAICKALYRIYYSHCKVLQWQSSSSSSVSVTTRKFFWFSLGSLILFAVLLWHSPAVIWAALPFLALWMASPWVIKILNKSKKSFYHKPLTNDEKLFFRHVARRSWRYFDEFVTEKTNWLPPDNYQEMLNVEVAQRTSSTNIGMYLVSLLSARNFGYLTGNEALARMDKTIDTLLKLELYEGNLLNWYDIQTLQPLLPRYVSTVDSGNLIASLWTLQEGIREILNGPIFYQNRSLGLIDTLLEFKESIKNLSDERLYNQKIVTPLLRLFSHFGHRTFSSIKDLQKAQVIVSECLEEIEKSFTDKEKEAASKFKVPEPIYWLKKLKEQMNGWLEIESVYFSWIQHLEQIPHELLDLLPGISQIIPEMIADWSYEKLATGELINFSNISSERIQAESTTWIIQWNQLLGESSEKAKALIQWANKIYDKIQKLLDGMHLGFLYQSDRKLFSIGYNVTDRRLDSSYYDLLASEARMASFVSIAQGDVPLEHWWALGRPFGVCFGHTVLQSWGGTMFEFLMPLLWMRSFENTLLTKATRDAVRCQIDYGRLRGIPWGISESAYSGLDFYRTYQYRAFGVPGLGLKRGLEEDLVVTPYSSALAAMVNAHEAASNLQSLGKVDDIQGTYGFYEAIDYTRLRGPEGDRGVIVYAYMAHHVGMTLVSLDNVLHHQIIQTLFHRCPAVIASEFLLYERVSKTTPRLEAHFREALAPKLNPIIPPHFVEQFSPQTIIPHTHLLSNKNYSLMVSNTGSGYSVWDNIDVTRWRADSTSDQYGNFFYIKDVEKNKIWSATYFPIQTASDKGRVNFKADKAEFTRRESGIECITEVVVSPEDNAEVRCLTLANLSMHPSTIEITSYQELALAPHSDDRAHPAFSKMFVETEFIPDMEGLLAHRRQRSENDPAYWALHTIAMEAVADDPVEFETDRDKFIGTGRSLQDPVGMLQKLTGTVGCTLDPIFSLRKRIVIEPGERIQISFITAVASTRKDIVSLLQKYKDFRATKRAMEMAWTHAELELRYMHISHEKGIIFQQLAGNVIYPTAHLRASTEAISENKLGQQRLWAYGISGDLPIVTITISSISDIGVVKDFIIAHSQFWKTHGLKCDLIILNEQASSYQSSLQQQLQRMIVSYSQLSQDKRGNVFLLSFDQLPKDELILIYTVSRVLLNASRGSLRTQLLTPIYSSRLAGFLKPNPHAKEEPSSPLPFLQLLFFNGIGGFTTDYKEYAILIDQQKYPPAPWINVIANANFGIFLSSRGLGASWYLNSQNNRLTPWTNDPVMNPIVDIIYLRDEDSGVFWSISCSPIQEFDAYRVRHGQGYTFYEHNSHAIEQELLVFVPFDDVYNSTLRLSKLRLTNQSSKKRRLSIIVYSELILGTHKEETQMFIETFWDEESESLCAKNSYHPYLNQAVTFMTSSPRPSSYTGDRTEFIGRNGSLKSPDALKRIHLSNNVGTALDPCGAYQITIEMAPGEQEEIILLLGETHNIEKARELIYHYADHHTIDSAFQSSRQWWDQLLTTIQVETPDQATNVLFNRWLLYQNLSCRIWGRTAFYQSSGAYGFRDQLQDMAAMVYCYPQLTKEHILLCASRQFIEGDVQHWWDPQTNQGVRTRISDDLLWLPYVMAHYIEVTGDQSILQEEVPFLEGRQLAENEHEAMVPTTISTEKASLLEHCCRAIDRALVFGPHGLPLIGGGDWNDGMNCVGLKGKGESVWLAWFLITVMKSLLPYAKEDKALLYQQQIDQLKINVETHAWDGEWYRRAYFDDGSPIGSKENDEDKIDSIAQSWAVLSGAGDLEHAKKAMASVKERLVRKKEGMVLLFDPPFDHSSQNPGYIKGYPPGVRENGGQYTHAVQWYAAALAQLGEKDEAFAILHMVNPINHSLTPEDVQRYKVEPYVVVADIYNLPGNVGRGGWTWYTGSTGWMYRVWLEEIFGFKQRGNQLEMNPKIPSHWQGFKMHFRHGHTHYEIVVENNKQEYSIELDGQVLQNKIIPLSDDGKGHLVRILCS